MDWHPTFGVYWGDKKLDDSGHTLGWTGYTWNNIYFPDPPKFLSWAHDQGLKVTLNMHPASGVQPFEEKYPEMARAMGIDPATKKYVPFDIADKKFATNYMNIMHRPLEKQGVDFFWLDWQQENKTSLPGLAPTWWLNYVHFTDMEREGKRPLIYHRWGGLGNHRYQIGFSGDVISDWSSLAFQPQFTSTAANVGYGYWSHDIGGHIPGTVEPELYTRWLQWGVFSPILRTHMTKNPDAERRVWAFPEQYAEVMRNALLLRRSLIPYIYTEARNTYDSGISICHPLYYDYPEVQAAYDANANSEYAFGKSLIVAPVVSPLDPVSQLAGRKVWLPDGDWIEWPTGAHFHGSKLLDRTFRLDETPVYARAGSIIPMQTPAQSAQAQHSDPMVLQVFPGARGEGDLYEDSGASLGYKQSEFAHTHFRQQRNADGSLEIEILPVEGSYPGMPASRAYELRLFASWPAATLTLNGQPIPYTGPEASSSGWRYDGDAATTIIELPATPITQKQVVRLNLPNLTPVEENLLDGLQGKLTRLHGAMHILEGTWPKGWAPDPLLHAAQTGRRVTLNPALAVTEFQRLQLDWQDIVKSIEDLNVDHKYVGAALAHLKN
jgi:alpha-glucosidase